MTTVHIFFGWPNGGVWSNIMASAIWVVPGYLWGRYHAKKFHAKLDKIHKHLGIDDGN